MIENYHSYIETIEAGSLTDELSRKREMQYSAEDGSVMAVNNVRIRVH